MKNNVKKVMRNIIIILLLFSLGFCVGYLFNRARAGINKTGTEADVRDYDEAAQRIERAEAAIGDAAGNVREAAGEVRISIDEAGIIREVAGNIERGNDRALDGVSGIADGIQRVMEILDKAEKRSADMEGGGNVGLD